MRRSLGTAGAAWVCLGLLEHTPPLQWRPRCGGRGRIGRWPLSFLLFRCGWQLCAKNGDWVRLVVRSRAVGDRSQSSVRRANLKPSREMEDGRKADRCLEFELECGLPAACFGAGSGSGRWQAAAAGLGCGVRKGVDLSANAVERQSQSQSEIDCFLVVEVRSLPSPDVGPSAAAAAGDCRSATPRRMGSSLHGSTSAR